MEYKGRVYQTQLEQWSFFIKVDQEEYFRGCVFESKEEAQEELERLLLELAGQ